jgi:hypothetical protein
LAGQDTVQFASNGTERMRIDSGGSVLIGSSSVFGAGLLCIAASLNTFNPIAFKNTIAQGPGQNFIYFTNSANDACGSIIHNATASIAYNTAASTASGAQLNASGITFPATQVASANANTLDDYEEGTWTATLLSTSGTITVNAGNNTGLYTKIGRTVNVSGYIDVSSVSSPSGRLRLNGFPFAAVGDGVPVGMCYFTTTNAFTGVPWCLGETGNTYIYIDRNAGTGADPAVDLASAMKAGSEIYFNFTYTTS